MKDNTEEQRFALQHFELAAEDLAALAWAARFASRDPQRPVLGGIYLDADGRLVACEGHRLLSWRLPALEGLAAPVLLQPADGDVVEIRFGGDVREEKTRPMVFSLASRPESLSLLMPTRNRVPGSSA